MEVTASSGKAGGARELRQWRTPRRCWGRRGRGDELRASRVDSFTEVVEDGEAHLVGISTDLGEVSIGGGRRNTAT